VHITADAEHGEVAVKMLSLLPKSRWDYIRKITLEQSALMKAMWNSALGATAAAV
jgi:hypothetical protein